MVSQYRHCSHFFGGSKFFVCGGTMKNRNVTLPATIFGQERARPPTERSLQGQRLCLRKDRAREILDEVC